MGAVLGTCDEVLVAVGDFSVITEQLAASFAVPGSCETAAVAAACFEPGLDVASAVEVEVLAAWMIA